MKHTEGPWRLNVDIITDERGRGIAQVYDGGVGWYCPLEDEESIANANLIAAAPEMLEFLKIIAYSDKYKWLAIRDEAGELIAKAEGENET